RRVPRSTARECSRDAGGPPCSETPVLQALRGGAPAPHARIPDSRIARWLTDQRSDFVDRKWKSVMAATLRPHGRPGGSLRGGLPLRTRRNRSAGTGRAGSEPPRVELLRRPGG